MIAFAANSVLNRLAVDSGAIDPRSFAVIRVVAGALMLTLLVFARRQRVPLLVGKRIGARVVAGGPWQAAPTGVALAVVSGTVTSGLGYALWYSVLPRLAPSVAATVQLSVPVIALGGGVVLLGEAINARLIVGGALVIGGIALSVRVGTNR